MAALDARYRALARRGRAMVWNEALRLFPLKDGRVDLERPQHPFAGAVRHGTEKASNASGGGAEAWATRVSASEAEARITRATYTGPQIREGDKIRCMDRTGQPFYEVAAVNDRDAGDLILRLVEA
ncbi:hypothetical protein E3C22_18175 [Jiella endophytica]|uniref:Head-tail adaptor protein n=1 Tax=Jiella endophytica TaxID=2558362 RepID=A0A4Y8RET5_9HYPH|nr:hypothetical protein [Jiella endophytica]TFF20815.1 hypothetical protein E3C22_18175 [Jiella endophytica]